MLLYPMIIYIILARNTHFIEKNMGSAAPTSYARHTRFNKRHTYSNNSNVYYGLWNPNITPTRLLRLVEHSKERAPSFVRVKSHQPEQRSPQRRHYREGVRKTSTTKRSPQQPHYCEGVRNTSTTK